MRSRRRPPGRCGGGRPSTNGAWYSSESVQHTCLGQPGRDGDRHRPARAQHAGQLVERAPGRRGCARAPRRRSPGRRRRRRTGRRVPSPCTAPASDADADLAGLDHGAEGVADLLQLAVGEVERHDPRPASRRLVGVATEAAAQVQQPVARLAGRVARSGRSASASGPAGRSPGRAASLAWFSGMASTSRYWSTVSCGAVPPAPPLDHPLAAGGADPGPQLGVVQAAGDGAAPARRRRRAGSSARSRRRARSPPAARHPWWRPGRCRSTWPRRRGARSPRTGWARRPAMASAYSSTMRSSVTPDTQVMASVRPRRSMAASARPPGLGRPITVSVTSLLGAQLGHAPPAGTTGPSA